MKLKVYNQQMSHLLGRAVYDDMPGQDIKYTVVPPEVARRHRVIVVIGLAILGMGALIKAVFFG